MAETPDYTTWSTEGLKQESERFFDKSFKLEIEDAAQNAEMIKRLNSKRTLIENELRARELAEIEKLEKKPAITVSSSVNNSKAESSGLAKDMLVAIGQIPMFDVGSEAAEFVADLENCFLNYVKGATGLESRFVKACIARLGRDYKRQLLQGTEDVDTWAKLKSYIELNYASKQTVYQKMATLLDLIPDNGDWTAFATKLENRSNSVFSFVSDAYSKEKGGAVLSAKNLMSVWNVMIFLQRLRDSRDRDAFNHIIGQLDSAWDLPSVVTKAKGYLDRAIRDDENGEEALNASFFGRQPRKANRRSRTPQRTVTLNQNQAKESPKESNKKSEKRKEFFDWVKANPGVCYKWAVKGNCTYEATHGKKCPHDHSFAAAPAVHSYTEPNALFTQQDFQQ